MIRRRHSDSTVSRTPGAYLLMLQCRVKLVVSVGRLGRFTLPAGRYVYVGSARGGIETRVARHLRFAQSGKGRPRWHIDHLLLHPGVKLAGFHSIPGGRECAISERLNACPGTRIPIPGFGATDCLSACGAHLYRILSFHKLTSALS